MRTSRDVEVDYFPASKGAASAVISEGSRGVDIKNERRAHSPTVAMKDYQGHGNDQRSALIWEGQALGLKIFQCSPLTHRIVVTCNTCWG